MIHKPYLPHNFPHNYNTDAVNVNLNTIIDLVKYTREMDVTISNMMTELSMLRSKTLMMENEIENLNQKLEREEIHNRHLESIIERLEIDPEVLNLWKDFLLILRLKGLEHDNNSN